MGETAALPEANERQDEANTELEERCVVIPTTGGLVWILGLKSRERLKSSYAVLENDFRHLKLSKDYHQFVSGPLTAVREATPVSELTLSQHIDTGRSWEFPTLIAHLLQRAGRLRFPDTRQLEQTGDPGCDLIWATGMCDPELSPVAADYMLPRKHELSLPLFEACAKAGRKVDIFLARDLPADERRQFADTAERLGFAYHEVERLEDIETRLDPAQSTGKRREPWAAASGKLALPPLLGALPLPAKYRLPALASLGFIALFGLFWLLMGQNPSGPSIPTTSDGNRGKAGLSSQTQLLMEQLTARDKADCQERVLMASRFERKTLAMNEASRYRIVAKGYLCGLRFRNDSEMPMRLKLGPELESYAILGTGALFSGRELRPGKHVDLYLSRPPARLNVGVGVTRDDNVEHTLALEFARP